MDSPNSWPRFSSSMPHLPKLPPHVVKLTSPTPKMNDPSPQGRTAACDQPKISALNAAPRRHGSLLGSASPKRPRVRGEWEVTATWLWQWFKHKPLAVNIQLVSFFMPKNKQPTTHGPHNRHHHILLQRTSGSTLHGHGFCGQILRIAY